MKDAKKTAGRKISFHVNSSCLGVMRDVALFLHVFLYFKIIPWSECIIFIFIINTAIFNYEVWKSEITLFCNRLLQEAVYEMRTERQGETVFPEEETAPPEAKGKVLLYKHWALQFGWQITYKFPRGLKQYKTCSVLNQFLSTFHISKVNFPIHTQK